MTIQINNYMISVTRGDVIIFCVVVAIEVIAITAFLVRRYRRKHGRDKWIGEPSFPKTGSALPRLVDK